MFTIFVMIPNQSPTRYLFRVNEACIELERYCVAFLLELLVRSAYWGANTYTVRLDGKYVRTLNKPSRH